MTSVPGPKEYPTIAEFELKGYFLYEFGADPVLDRMRDTILDLIRREFGRADATLENYHTLVRGEEENVDFHYKVFEAIGLSGLYKKFFLRHAALFHKLIGADVQIQAEPHIRIIRPQTGRGETIGYHRDNYYGGTPYETIFFLPFTSTAENNTLCVIEGSHLLAETEAPEKVSIPEGYHVEKGSRRHRLGYPYLPKDVDNLERFGPPVPLAVSYGQAVVFNSCLIHGAVNEYSTVTRWSMDLAFRSPFAPRRFTRPGYWAPFLESATTRIARKFYGVDDVKY